MKYLLSGQEVEIVQKLESGKLLVYPVFETSIQCGDGCLEPDWEYAVAPIIVDKVYDKPPTAKIEKDTQHLIDRLDELTIELCDLVKDRGNLKREIKELESVLESVKKYKGLENIEDFMEKRITHVVVDKGYSRDIFEFDEIMATDSRYDGGVKLITLFGKTKGDLQFKINAYSDGSGCNDNIFLCKSYDEAVLKLTEIIRGVMDEERHRPNYEMLKLCTKHSIHVDQTYIDEYLAVEAAKREKKVNELKEQISKVESQEVKR